MPGMRAPRDVELPLGWQVDSDDSQDVLLCIDIEGTGRTAELRAPITIVVHSAYIRAALRFETATYEGCKEPVKLTAAPESEWCPAAVLTFLETGKIDLSIASSQRSLLLLLEYADYLCVDALVDGCLQCLMTMHMQRIEQPPHWSTTTFFMKDVSDAIRNSPFWPGACNLARLQALEAMQDLEHVLSTIDGCKRLMTLSYNVLLELCRCCSTKVAYESTVVAAITLWYTSNPWLSADELYELASTVCLRSLPRMYAATVLPQLPWWQQVIPEGTLLQAAEILAQATASTHCSEQADGGGRNQLTGDSCERSVRRLSSASSRTLRLALDALLLKMDKQRRNLYRLLLREPREMSRLHHLHLTAALTKQQLQKAYEGAQSSSNMSRWHGVSAWQTFAGINWQLTCSFMPRSSQRLQRWHLAVGVRFSVSGVHDPSAVSLCLPGLHLEHPRAVASGAPLTRLQLGQLGVHPAAAGHLVPAGVVLPCQEWLPLGLTGTDWDPDNISQISRYLDDNECVQLAVTVRNVT